MVFPTSILMLMIIGHIRGLLISVIFLAYLEVRSLGEFEENVRNHGDRWDDDIRLYKGYSWEDYGKEMFDCCCYQMEEHLQDFFDFEAYGRYMGDCAEEYSDGIIEILR